MFTAAVTCLELVATANAVDIVKDFWQTIVLKMIMTTRAFSEILQNLGNFAQIPRPAAAKQSELCSDSSLLLLAILSCMQCYC